MKKINKFLLGIVGLTLSFTLIGCNSTGASLGASIDSKLDRLSNTINSISKIESTDLAYIDYDQSASAMEVGLFNSGFGTPYYSNVNTYNLPTFGGLNGYNNFNYGGFNGNYGFGNPVNNYFGNGFAGGFNNFNNGMGYNPFNSIGAFGSNIDTYRISSITKDGKTYSTINTYKNGKPVPLNNANNSNDKQNLNNVCTTCIASNNYNENLKSAITNKIDNVKNISKKLKNGELKVNQEKVKTVNEYLDNLARLTSKINMTKGEFNTELSNVKLSKTSEDVGASNLNSKYIKLLSCMDTRNSFYQNILNSLLGIENCLDGACPNGTCDSGNCPNGTCPTDYNQALQDALNNALNGACTNCENCPDCSSCNSCGTCDSCLGCGTCNSCKTCTACEGCDSCTNCTNCSNCSNCTDCFNCENCKDCSNLANAKNCNGNCLNNDEKATAKENLPTETPNTDVENKTDTNKTENATTPSAENINEFDSDQVIRDNLLDNRDNGELDNMENGTFLNESDPLATTYPMEDIEERERVNYNHIETDTNEHDFVRDNSIINENEYENNKSLTA